MKMPLDWHRDCLKNMRYSHARSLEEIARLQEDSDRLNRNILILSQQIYKAIEIGKSEFDPDKFLKRSKNIKG